MNQVYYDKILKTQKKKKKKRREAKSKGEKERYKHLNAEFQRIAIREKNQINKIGNEKGEVAIDSAEKQRIIRDYYGQLYGNKMDETEKSFRKEP